MITISRKWNNPQIEVMVSGEGISLDISLKDFLTALKQEIDSVTFTFTKAAFDAQFDAAVERVLEGIKEESKKAV